jgi:hypothetical protein
VARVLGLEEVVMVVALGLAGRAGMAMVEELVAELGLAEMAELAEGACS